MLEILALCSCACVVCLWCATNLGSCNKKSKSHRKRHKVNRSTSCSANRNSAYKKIPKSCHDVSYFLNTPFICCKCNERSRKHLRRVQNYYTPACNTSNLSKPYAIVHSCSDPGAQIAVFTKTTKSTTTSYAPPPSTSLSAMCKNISTNSAQLPDQCFNQSQSKMYDVRNNEQSTNFSPKSPEDKSYEIPQEPINDIVPKSVPRPVCSALRSPCVNYYNSIKSAPLYKLICKTCQLEKHKCICPNFWCNPIFNAGYPQFFGSNFSFPSDSPEFTTSKGTLTNCAPIVLYPWSTVPLAPMCDLHGNNLKNKKSPKKLSSTHKRLKKSENREIHERKR